MRIRPACEADAWPLLAFYHSLSDKTAEVFLPPGPVTMASITSHLDSIAERQCISFVLERGGEIMGHAFIQNVGSRTPMVGIGLRDEIIGQGYGRLLLEHVLSVADEMELPSTFLNVVKTNKRAETLYAHLGFVRRGEATHRRRGDSWHMERRLPPPGRRLHLPLIEEVPHPPHPPQSTQTQQA